MEDGQELNLEGGSQPAFEIAWMQLRMGWQSVKRTRLDQEKKDAIDSIIRHYKETGEPDRSRFEFEQVLLRLEEEHDYRLKELERDARRSEKVQKSTMRVVRDNNDTWMQDRRDRAEETPRIIAEWKELLDVLFPAPGPDVSTGEYDPCSG